MKYTFRPNLFQKSSGVQLANRQLQVLDKNGGVRKSINLQDIRSLQRLDCGIAKTPDGGKETFEQCTIRYASFGELTIKSASYAGPKKWDGHGPKYRMFLSNLMDALVQEDSAATLIKGSGGLVMVWRFVQVIALLLVVAGIAMFVGVLRSGNLAHESTPVAATGAIAGALVFLTAHRFASIHRPSRTSVKEAREM